MATGNREPAAGGGRAVRLVLSGYYGFGNSGDEAVLLSILQALDEAFRARGRRFEPVVLSGDPDWTARRYGVEAVPRMKPAAVMGALRGADGLVSGGGSLLQDATGLGSIPYYLGVIGLALRLGKPAFVYAQGIGPVRRRFFRPLIARAFNRCAYVSVRDEESAAALREYGVDAGRIEVVPDPVMGLSDVGGANPAMDSRPADLAEPALVGVSVRFWRDDRADLDRMAEALAALASMRPVRYRFLPMHRGADEEASRHVMRRLEQLAGGDSGAETSVPGVPSMELAPAHDDPRDMLREAGACRLLAGMRLHALIYAANRRVPMLGLSYDPKIDRFLASIGQSPAGTTEALDPSHFAREAAKLLDDPDAWRRAAEPSIGRLAEAATRPAQQIAAYFV
jgi:polysaccharide pyruvyl transferase CsaB